MSGRLVILPHKSWHVWNKDNREKVLRDERLHREEEERRATANRQLVQEQTNELLLRQQGEQAAQSDDIVGGVEEKPFRLFEDVERQQTLAKKAAGNEDYKREHEAQVLAQQRKEGVAPLALGDGSLEFKRSKPWYMQSSEQRSNAAKDTSQTKSTRADSLSIPRWGVLDHNQEIARENERKSRFDPASLFCNPESLKRVEVSCSESKESSENFEQSEAKIGDSDVEEGETKKRRHKEEDRHKQKKKKKHKKEKGNQQSKREDSMKQQDDEKVERDRMLQELRFKRLEREKIEKKRTNLLLAHMDIYGTSNSRANSATNEHRTFHSQYNPGLSRK
jgi:hypothetical protein